MVISPARDLREAKLTEAMMTEIQAVVDPILKRYPGVKLTPTGGPIRV